MRHLLMLVLVISSLSVASAQDGRPRRLGEAALQDKAPVLTAGANPYHVDELQNSVEGQVYLRIGRNIPISLTESPSVQIELNDPLSTKGMNGTTIYRGLLIRSDIPTAFGETLTLKDSTVETRITGHASGFKDRALLMIEPRTVQIRLTKPILIEIAKDGKPVFLKPGVWVLRLRCTIQSVESEELHWYANNDSESITIKGKRFSSSQNHNSFSDPYSDLQLINPLGTFAYGMTKVAKFTIMLLRRPNIYLAPSTQLFFRIDRIEATYLTPIHFNPVDK